MIDDTDSDNNNTSRSALAKNTRRAVLSALGTLVTAGTASANHGPWCGCSPPSDKPEPGPGDGEDEDEEEEEEEEDEGEGNTAPEDIPDRFYTDGPPERDGETITYPSDGHSSLQDAVESLSEGDTLYIEPGTYQERIFIDDSVADHITIESDLRLDYDDFGVASVQQEGAIIEMPDEDPGYAFGCDNMWYGSDAELTDTYPEYDGFKEDSPHDTIAVSDASEFSEGDDIRIEESGTRPYGIPQSGGADNSDDTIEYRTVESVDTSNDTLTLDVPLFMPYPGENTGTVSVLDWNVEDLCLRGITFRAPGPDEDGDYTPVDLVGVKNGWIENVICENGGEDPLLSCLRCYETRLNNIYLRNSHHYGIQTRDSSTRILITNAYSDDIKRYTAMFGSGSNNSSDGMVVGVSGNNHKTRSVIDAHSGAYHHDFRDVYSNDAVTMTPRSYNLRVNGFEVTGGESQAGNGNELIFRQRIDNVHVQDGYVHDRTTDSAVFDFGLRYEIGDDEPEWIGNLVIEDVEIEDYGVDITDIGEFTGDQEADSITLRNITYDGQQLTESDVEQWDGFDSVTINDLTVE